jgi:hypothetical protein
VRSSPISRSRLCRLTVPGAVLAAVFTLPVTAAPSPFADGPVPLVWRGDDGSLEFLAPSVNGNLRGSVRGIDTEVVRTEMWLEHAPAEAADVTILLGDPYAVGVEIAFHDAGGPLGELWFRYDALGDGEGDWKLLHHSLSDCRAVRLSSIYGALLSVARDVGTWVESLEARLSEPQEAALVSLPILLAARFPTVVESCPSLQGGSGECGAANDYRECERCCAALGDELETACRVMVAICALRYSPCSGAQLACGAIKRFTASSCVDGNCGGLPGDPSCDEDEMEPCEDVGGTCQFTCLITKKGVCGECPDEGDRCCK